MTSVLYRCSPVVLAALLFASSSARAQVAPTGAMTGSTLKLPDGPGSVAGLAKAAELDLFSAQVSYSIPIKVPTAGGLSPSVALSYSGALGNGPVGIGWALGAPAIRRSLRHGIPRYDDSDELTIEGVASGRLVRIAEAGYVVEGAGSTIRVRRYGDYFEVTDGGGTRYYFGHTASARQADSGRVAAWFLQEVVDLAGERMRFTYVTERGEVYLQRVAWGPDERYQLEVRHEARPDVVPSYATGFSVTTARRIDRVRSLVVLPGESAREIARYELQYADEDEDPSNDGPLSQLTSVTMTGLRDASDQLLPGGTLPPVSFTYAVSAAPRSWALDSGGWVLEQRGVALVDVDGDGADDLLRLEAGNAAWRKNLGGRFGAATTFGNANALELSKVRFLDIDGDARPEVVRLVDDQWRAYPLAGAALGDGRVLAGTRGVDLGGESTVLADIDGDGRTDVIEAVTSGITMRRGVPLGLGPPAFLPPINAAEAYVEPGVTGVRFLDANGDGLADVVYLTDAWMKVYLGRGNGTFEPYTKVFYPWGTGAIPLDFIHLVDLDRDGVLDLLRVDAGKVRWFSGLAGFRFERLPRQLDRPPGADADVRVTFADVDGNGSQDVVWSNLSAMWALDLAGGTTRAMVASIDDGMGEVQHISYGTSTQLSLEAEAAGEPWARKLPRAMAVPVRQETVYADGTPSRFVNAGIRDGYWDGAERRFGGFLLGRTVVPGETQAQIRVEETSFHAGEGNDRVLRGKPVDQRIRDGLGTLYTVTTTAWFAIRPASLAGALEPEDPLLRRAVMRTQEAANHEGVTTPITTRLEISYDAEARPFEERSEGRSDLCGDERTTWRRYASDDTTWVRDRVIEEELHSGLGRSPETLVSHTRHYFGNHEGGPLAHGQVGFGWLRKTEGLLWSSGSTPTAPRWVTLSTADYDAHGNVIATTEGPTRAESSTGGGVARTVDYDDDGLFPVRESIEPVTGRVLSWTAAWDPLLSVVSRVTTPAGDTTHVEYDPLARVTALRQNGNPAHQRYVYEWSAPRPRTFSYSFEGELRSLPTFATQWNRTDQYVGWKHTVTVADSAGDELFSAGRLGTNQWLVNGWKRKDARGRVTDVLEGFTHNAAALPVAPPENLRRQLLRYDAMDRAYQHELPTGARTTTSFRAFEQTVAVDGLAPVTSTFDGEGRIRRTQRTIDATVESVDAIYDAAGRILSLELQKPVATDAGTCPEVSAAVAHRFIYDSFGRLIEADDPDIGLRLMTYDDAGHLTRHVNGAAQGITLGYDLAGRLTSRVADDGTRYDYHYDVDVYGNPTPGYLSFVDEPTGQVRLGYDEFGRNNYVWRQIGSTRLAHDIGIAPSGALYVDRHVRDWSSRYYRDMAGRVIRVAGSQSGVNTTLWEATSFDSAGRLATERYGNGVVGRYTYDRNGQTERIVVERSDGGERLYDAALTRNEWGAVTDVDDTDLTELDHDSHFGYDAAGRLTSADIGARTGTGAVPYAFTYRYDGLQNMIDRTATMATPRPLGQHLGVHCYGQNGAGPRQLTSIVTAASGSPSACDSGAPVVASFTYDDAGRQLTDGESQMTYDGLDQLVTVNLPGGLRVDYAYGYDGQRIRTTDNQGSIPEHWFSPDLREVGGVLDQYVKVGDRVIAKVKLADDGVKPDAAKLATRARGRDVGIALCAGLALLLGGVGAAASCRRRSWRPTLAVLLIAALFLPGCDLLFGSSDAPIWRAEEVTYFHTGFAAGPVLITSEVTPDDPVPRVVDERLYEPFGQGLESNRESGGFFDRVDYALEPFNVLNKPTDARTGWSYHGARWTAPQTARWLTPDPPVKAPDPKLMGGPWRLHPYQYVDQNPVVYWDPDGRDKRPTGRVLLVYGIFADDLVETEKYYPESVRSAVVNMVAKRISKDSKMDVVPVKSETDIKAAVNAASYDRIVYVGHASTSSPMLLPDPTPRPRPGSRDLHRNFIDAAVLVPDGETPTRIDLITCSAAATGALSRISERLDEGAVVTGYTAVIVFEPKFAEGSLRLTSLTVNTRKHGAKYKKVVTPPVPSVTRDNPKE